MSEERTQGGSAQARTEGLSRKDLFLGLIHSFQAAAMQQMGKVPNPFTAKIERDLAQARLSIDMLEMLEERTTGNLTGEESRFLTHVLTELRLNYVAELDEEKKAAAKGPAEPQAGSPGQGAPGQGSPGSQGSPSSPPE